MASVKDPEPTTVEPTPAAGGIPDQRTPEGGSSTARGRRGALAVFSVLGVVALAVGTFAAVRFIGSQPEPLDPTAPIALPSTIGALAAIPAATDLTTSAEWKGKAASAVGASAYAARIYAPAGGKRTVRLVVARTDLTGKLEQGWAQDAGTPAGDYSCTHNVKLTASTPAKERPTVLVCWRSTPSLSAYAVVIDPLAPVTDPAEATAALDAAWKAASAS